MNYFAFFLSETGYIEKCLMLLKYVGNPNSKSVPHITLRLFKDSDSKLDYLRDKEISYLNIVEPGTFNFDNRNSSSKYVVYLKCESEELEELDYRPDYPFSRLHITLYEGNDFEYASFLYEEICNIPWHIKLRFETPVKLKEKRLGSSSGDKPDYNRLGKEILGDSFNLTKVASGSLNNLNYEYAQVILNHLKTYLNSSNKVRKITSFLVDHPESQSSILDERDKTIILPDQMSIPGLDMYDVKKNVQDAIFVTPPEYAKDMVTCALDVFDPSDKMRFGDSAVGTGSLYLALKRQISEYNNLSKNKEPLILESAVGVDIDLNMAQEAYKRFSKRDLKVICGDSISPSIDLGETRNLMIVNPPYNRHEHIPDDYKKQIALIAKRQTGISVSANAGLYVYHMLIMDKWLAHNGIGVWLIPSVFLQANYGKSLRQYLTQNVQLLRLHIYDEKQKQFDRAMISTTIVVFKKTKPMTDAVVNISYGESLENPTKTVKIPFKTLADSLDNWRSVITSFPLTVNINETNGILFSDLFDVKRGIATGANNFFVITLDKAIELGIPMCAVKPLLPKARYISSTIIQAFGDGFPDVNPRLVVIDCDLDESEVSDKYPEFYQYLQQAKIPDSNGKRIIDRVLVSSRKPWYKQELRSSPLFFLTYMGREKKDLPALYFFLNKSKAIALNNYLLVYPRQWLSDLLQSNDDLCSLLLNCLNDATSNDLLQNSRIYSGGLFKLEPRELCRTHLFNLPVEIIEAYNKHRKFSS